MLAYLLEKISNWLESAERSRRDAYLASSVDIRELEQRLRAIERNDYAC